LVELNRLENVVLYQAAVSNVAGKLRFLPSEGQFSSGVGRLVEDDCQSDDSIEVDSLVLDQMFKAEKFPAPRMIVMDVEGVELFVLEGAQKILSQCVPHLILEVQPPLLRRRQLSMADLFDFLEARDYTCWVIGRWGLRPATREGQENANWLCISKKSDQHPIATARYVSRQLKLASFLPLVKGINPAVIMTY
jgi:FkbM family methyltransferase